jgi:hypothetical protein
VPTCRDMSLVGVPVVRGDCEIKPDTIGLSEMLAVKPVRSVIVIDDCSDWMSFHDALAHVETTQKCYQELAIKLLLQATDNLKIRSRTFQGSPRWVVSGDKYYSDDGRDLQFCREDVLRLWPEQQNEVTASTRSRIKSGAISVGVSLALHALWPSGVPAGLRAKDRDKAVHKWLKDHNKSIPSNLPKAVQRALKRT